jgi:hypothetical protein
VAPGREAQAPASITLKSGEPFVMAIYAREPTPPRTLEVPLPAPAQLTGLHRFHVSGADVPRVSRTVSSFKSTITIFVPAPASFAGTT